MPALKDLLRKKDKLGASGTVLQGQQNGLQQQRQQQLQQQQAALNVPEFKIIRSTTELEEEIEPPTFDDDEAEPNNTSKHKSKPSISKPHLHFRKSSNATVTKDPTAIVESAPTQASDTPTSNGTDNSNSNGRPSFEKRLSYRLHFRSHSRTASAESIPQILPNDLPDAPQAISPRNSAESRPSAEEVRHSKEAQANREAQWEKRATILAQAQQRPLAEQQQQAAAAAAAQQRSSEEQQQQRQSGESSRRGSTTHSGRNPHSRTNSHARTTSTATTRTSLSSVRTDDDIQEASRLHEIGELKLATDMFGRLANPNGANNALAQVLYGLSLRHGWGVPVDTTRAIHYLSLAAANSAAIERAALETGLSGGGEAKGELVIAIFELANCFRHGWGLQKVDARAARTFYETAANLGDVDAMEEAAWCFLEGFGGPKDKFAAARYLRLAEEKGRRLVGNSWVWKEKYNVK